MKDYIPEREINQRKNMTMTRINSAIGIMTI